jgi:glycosyltransferase involved in cell wall biosynthesis
VKLNIIYRKRNPKYFSIEKVFETMIPFLPKAVEVNRSFVREGRATLKAIISNLMQHFSTSDIYHVTGDIHYMAMAFPSKKTVLTIHDCVFMYQSTGVKRKIMQWLWLKLPVKKAGLVTVISETTKKDVIRYTGCEDEKIVVIPNPIGTEFKYVSKAFNKQMPRLLHVGTWENKNLLRVAEALSNLSCELVVIGQLTEMQKTLLQKYKIEYHNSWGLSEKELVMEYEKCDIVIFVSTYEGFGLPIIEGQTVGRVVVTSNIPPMADIAGDSAILADPFSVQSIRDAVLKVIGDDEFRESLISKGLINVRSFTATAVADRYYQQYLKLLQRRN